MAIPLLIMAARVAGAGVGLAGRGALGAVRTGGRAVGLGVRRTTQTARMGGRVAGKLAARAATASGRGLRAAGRTAARGFTSGRVIAHGAGLEARETLVPAAAKFLGFSAKAAFIASPLDTVTLGLADQLFEGADIEQLRARLEDRLRRDGLETLDPHMRSALVRVAQRIHEQRLFEKATPNRFKEMLEEELAAAGADAQHSLRRLEIVR